MADIEMPDEMIAWMSARNWGAHHDQWHFERRWDFWHALAARPDHPPWVDELIAEALAKSWSRASLQEGEAGNGEDFLFMHRAMFHLLVDNFPQHLHLMRGWNTPPRDPSDADDPVPPVPPGDLPNPSKGPFDGNMATAVSRIEAAASAFVTDDDLGRFLETAMRPIPGDPFARSPDPQTGLHNYLHNRWSDDASPINLGAPTVNIFNWRFWKLHGWIDHQWWRFRRAKGLDDNATSYRATLAEYIAMMGRETHPDHGPHATIARARVRTRNLFVFDVPR